MPNEPPKTGKSRFPWRALFHRSQTPLFVLSGNGRLRYVNPAWETLTKSDFAQLRGTRVSKTRISASPLWRSLAPTPEAWAGKAVTVRRAAPNKDTGPPWWDVTFLPLLREDRKPLAIIGTIELIATTAGTRPKFPAGFGCKASVGAIEDPFRFFTSTACERIVIEARFAASQRVPVWITGERGSGKATLARAIHDAGHHKDRYYVSVDCRGLQPYLVEGLLFGNGGLSSSKHTATLHLRNPELLPRDLQTKIVAWLLQPSAPRVISTSEHTSIEMMNASQLVQSYHTRLTTFTIAVPPLRERFDELPRIADALTATRIHDDVWPVLQSYHWPGNVRELAEILGLAKIAANGDTIRTAHLPRLIREKWLIDSSPAPVQRKPLEEELLTFERQRIEETIRDSETFATAAKRLGMPKAKLVKRMAALGIVEEIDDA